MKELLCGYIIVLETAERGDKLSKRWLGPYKVSKVLGKVLYRLANLDTRPDPSLSLLDETIPPLLPPIPPLLRISRLLNLIRMKKRLRIA